MFGLYGKKKLESTDGNWSLELYTCWNLVIGTCCSICILQQVNFLYSLYSPMDNYHLDLDLVREGDFFHPFER